MSEILAPLLTFTGYRAHKLTGSLSRVLNGKAALTPNLALRLELAGIGNARLWLDMQTAYGLAQARSKETPRVEPLVAL